MFEFDYRRPTSLDEAVALLSGQRNARPLAGGMSLLSAMKLRLADHDRLVDLGRIKDLQGIELTGRTLTIGAMTRHAQVAASADVLRTIPSLAALAADIGDRQVRNRGTIGGSLANNDPAACYPAAGWAWRQSSRPTGGRSRLAISSRVSFRPRWQATN